ncbi:hypothetical protein D9M71_720590 [compost metagenome]
MELRDRDGGRGRDVVRIHNFQQSLGESRKLGVQLDLGAGRQETEGLDQALDIGVGDLDTVHAQASGDFRVLSREFAGELAHVDEFPVVVIEQLRIHGLGACQ